MIYNHRCIPCVQLMFYLSQFGTSKVNTEYYIIIMTTYNLHRNTAVRQQGRIAMRLQGRIAMRLQGHVTVN